jgi:hypothetical protein
MQMRRYVTLERDGTHIEISGNLALDTLIDMATTMSPVNEDAPES